MRSVRESEVRLFIPGVGEGAERSSRIYKVNQIGPGARMTGDGPAEVYAEDIRGYSVARAYCMLLAANSEVGSCTSLMLREYYHGSITV